MPGGSPANGGGSSGGGQRQVLPPPAACQRAWCPCLFHLESASALSFVLVRPAILCRRATLDGRPGPAAAVHPAGRQLPQAAARADP